MKHNRVLFIAALAGLVLGACTREENLEPQKRAIRFTTNLGAYVTKATDTNFEEGDAVSLFAEDPINALNVKMTFQGDELVPETVVSWPEDMPASQYANFFAVYPYRQDWEDLSDLSVFSVNADQSTHELYTASDLLGASYMAYPDCQTVPLNFTHRLARLRVYAYSDDITDPIKDVYVSGAYGKVRLLLFHSMSVYTVGEKGTVRAAKVDESVYTYGDYSEYQSEWSVILPPQQIDFKLVLVTESGKQYAFVANSWSQIYMESAHLYTASVRISDSSVTADETVQVTDWTADNDVQFGNYISDEFHTEGEWYLRKNGEEENLMANDVFEGEHFEFGINAETTDTYDFVYRVGRRELVFGLPQDVDSAIPEGKNLLVEGGKPFSTVQAAEYVVKVDPYNNIFCIVPDDEVWSLVGTLYGTNWDTDYDMTRESSGVYSIDIDYWGEEFKLRCNHDWYKNLGGQQMEYINSNNRYQIWYDGPNMTISQPGRYHITADVRNGWISMEFLEEYIPEGFESFMGDWIYQMDDENAVAINISQDGLRYLIDYDGHQFRATFNTGNSSFNVYFQRLQEWSWSSYGLTYDWPRAYYSIPDDDGTYWLYGEMSDLLLFTGAMNSDGTVDIQPGISYDGFPFINFEVLAVIQEGDYEGAYGRYGTSYPLPQVWTKNE